MIDVIQKKFSEIVLKSLKKHSVEFNCSEKDVQLAFKLDDYGEAEYRIMHKYKTMKVLSFLEVLGVKIDFKGYSLFVPRFIAGALNRLAHENNIEINDIYVITFDGGSGLKFWIYNSASYVKEITLESLFDTEDVLEIENQ